MKKYFIIKYDQLMLNTTKLTQGGFTKIISSIERIHKKILHLRWSAKKSGP